MFMFVPSEVRLQLLGDILNAANASSPEKVKALFDLVSMSTQPNIGITADNFLTLYPALDMQKHVLFALSGFSPKNEE